MGVDLRCEICNCFIRRVEVADITSITKDELCSDCDAKIKEVYAEFEDSVLKFKKSLDALNVDLSKELRLIKGSVDALHNEFDRIFKQAGNDLNRLKKDYQQKVDGLFKASRSELGDKIKNMAKYFK